MKKILTLALSLLMIASCFVFSVSAGNVNLAKNCTYAYETDMSKAFKDGLQDDACTLLTDGVVAETETPSETVGIQGTSKFVTVIFDLGGLYSDIKSVNFLAVWDSNTDVGGNRGFSGEKTQIWFSEDGLNYSRNKDFKMSRENRNPDGVGSYYDYKFKFNSDVKAKAVKIVMFSPVYILSLSEIEIIGGGAAPEAPVVSEEPSSEEIIEESSVEAPSEAVSEVVSEVISEAISEVASEAASEETSEVASEAASEAVSEAVSEAASEAASEEASKEADPKDDGGMSPVLIVVIVVVVVAAIVGVVIFTKKK